MGIMGEQALCRDAACYFIARRPCCGAGSSGNRASRHLESIIFYRFTLAGNHTCHFDSMIANAVV